MDNISSPTPMGDASPTTAAAACSEGGPEMKKYLLEARREDRFCKYVSTVSFKLHKELEDDSVEAFYALYSGGRRKLMVDGKFLRPEILHSMVARNAVRCARAVLEGTGPLDGRRADPNGRNRHGCTPLHSAAEACNVQMVELLLEHGASANIRTKSVLVNEGLLPLHLAVEKAAMHKYLEDNWAPRQHVNNLVSLLCLPEMKMFLDTTRLIAKHTDNIVDEVWIYIKNGKIVHAAILLLVAQKQLHGHVSCSDAKIDQNGFDIVRSRVFDAVTDLHCLCLDMVAEGKNGNALRKLKEKKDTFLSAKLLVLIFHKAGEALEEYIQNHSEASREDVLQHVSSIIKSCCIVSVAKGIDSGNLDFGLPRDKFFPSMKLAMPAHIGLKILPPCQPSMILKRSTHQLCSANKPMENFGKVSRPKVLSNCEGRRLLSFVASMTLKFLKQV